MPKVFARGINFHYQTRGEGPDVVLVHGVTSSLAAWYNGIFPSLIAAGFRVTIFDLRGHGLSDSTPTGYTSEDMATDMLALMDELGIEKPVVAGHSFGGAIAMHFAVLFPERVSGVVLLDSSMRCLRRFRLTEEWEGWSTRGEELAKGGFTLEWFLEMDNKQDLTDFLRKALSVNVRGFKRGNTGMTSRVRKLIEETKVGTEFRDVAGLTEERLMETYTPVLALFGSTSPNRPVAPHLAEIMPNCWHIIINGVGHFAAIHEPKVVLPQMIPFLRDPEGYVRRAKAGEPMNTETAGPQPALAGALASPPEA